MTPTETPDLTPSTLWPLRDLRVVSGDLELRFLDDELLMDLALLAADGVHAPDAMPFAFAWTDGTPAEVARRVLTYQWGLRAQVTPEKWGLELAVLRDGVPVGVQGAYASDYPVTRTAETGSWLGLRHQGAGTGTRMRVLALHLLFEGLGAVAATTSAFEDNPASNGVSRKVGYARNGHETKARQGAPATSLLYRMERAGWDARPSALRPDVTLHGVEAVREQLGIGQDG